MPNPGIFRGSRFIFLLGEKAAYKAGVDGGYAADALAKIQSRYFRRYPIELSLDDEPSPESLRAVDDEAPDTKQQEPDKEKLTDVEYKAEVESLLERTNLINIRKAQLKRWFAYHYLKDSDIDPKDSGLRNPYRVLLFKLTGVGLVRPRARYPVNTWRKMKVNRDTIEKEAKARGYTKKSAATVRSAIAKKWFEALDEEEQAVWKDLAQEEYDEEVLQFNTVTTSPPSTDPVDQQKCIEALPSFVAPFLDLLCEATGLKASLLIGGPEPAADGRLNIISIHSGTTKGDVPMNFGAAERVRFKEMIVPIFGDFLKKCYSVDECQAQALKKQDGFVPLSVMELEGMQLDSIHEHLAPLPPQTLQPATANVAASTRATVRTHGARKHAKPHLKAPEPLKSTTTTAVVTVAPVAPVAPTSKPLSNTLLPTTLGSMDLDSPPPSPPAHPMFDLPLSPTLIRLSLPPASPAPVEMLNERPSIAPMQPPLASSALTAIPIVNGATLTSPAAKKLNASKKRRVGEENIEIVGGGNEENSTNSGRQRKRAKRGKKEGVATSSSAPVPSCPIHVASMTRKSGRTHTLATTTISTPILVQSPASLPLSPSPPSASQSAASKPDWFTAAISMLEGEKGLGTTWAKLVKAWAAFEDGAGYEGTKKLLTTHRPDVIKAWIGRARSPTWRPIIPDTSAYESEYMLWWTAIQPLWRKGSDGSLIFSKVDGDWGVLQRPGLNGMLSVMAGLLFWGVALRDSSNARKGWNRAVSDCLIVINSLSV